MRSGTSRSAPHTRHQVWMSASVRACLADSIRLVLASCQPAATDSARAVRPASSRISRGGAPRPAAGLAERSMTVRLPLAQVSRWSDRLVLVVRNGAFPYGLERLRTQLHDGRVLRQLVLDDLADPGEEVEAHQAAVEHLTRCPRPGCAVRPPPGSEGR